MQAQQVCVGLGPSHVYVGSADGRVRRRELSVAKSGLQETVAEGLPPVSSSVAGKEKLGQTGPNRHVHVQQPTAFVSGDARVSLRHVPPSPT